MIYKQSWKMSEKQLKEEMAQRAALSRAQDRKHCMGWLMIAASPFCCILTWAVADPRFGRFLLSLLN